MKKNQNSSYELFCLKVNGSRSNWSLWILTPRHRHHLDSSASQSFGKIAKQTKSRTTQENQHTQKTQSKKPNYPGLPGQETEWPILCRPQDHTGQATG